MAGKGKSKQDSLIDLSDMEDESEEEMDLEATGAVKEEADKVSGVEKKLELSGDITIEEHRLIEALRMLKIKPKVTSPEDLLKLNEVFGNTKKSEDKGAIPKYIAPAPLIKKEKLPAEKELPLKKPLQKEIPAKQSVEQEIPALPVTEHRGGHYSYPKLSTFYGEDTKGEVTWETFKFEVDSLVMEKVFSSQQILLGIRRALKGNASDKVRRLGTGVSIQEIMDKLDNAYGNIESRETVMKKFYTCVQKTGESVETFASRLEEIFAQAVNLKALQRTDTLILKEKLYGGLRTELKQTARYQCDKIKEYDEFKRELRKLEAELKEEKSPERKPSKSAVPIQKETPEMKEMRELLLKLNSRIDTLEKEKEDRNYHRLGGNRGRGRGNFQGGARGRGVYRPQRPTGSTSFQPTCFNCNRKGHMRDTCPQLSDGIICFKCREPGHVQRNCPKA